MLHKIFNYVVFFFFSLLVSPSLIALQAEPKATSPYSTQELQGRYFLYYAGAELLNISAARLELGAERGEITLTQGSAHFSWFIDPDGIIQLSLDEPILTGRGFITVPGYSSSRVKEVYTTKIALKPVWQPDNSLSFSYETEQRVKYPDSNLSEEITGFSGLYHAVNASQQIAMRDLLPIDKWFSLPFDMQKNVKLHQSFFSITERAQRVKLTRLQANSATGVWQSLYPNEQQVDYHTTEEINVIFEADGSATFISASGKTANAMAFRRVLDGELVFNVVYSDSALQPPTQKLAVANTLNIKNPLFNRAASGIYVFKQNVTPFNTFWLALNSDGTGETVEIFDANRDGVITGDEVLKTPHLWQYVIDNNALKVEMRRYYYKRGSGADGVCIPQTFSPAHTETCVLERSRIIEFFDEGTLDGKSIVNTENKFIFYGNHFGLNNDSGYVPTSIIVDNRYYYTRDEPPISLPPLVQNDNLLAAKVILGNTGTVAGNTTSATKQPGEPCHFNQCDSVSVWYSFTAAENGDLSLTLTSTNLSNLKLSVYNGTSFTDMSAFGELQVGSDKIKWSAAVLKGWPIRIAVSHDQANTIGETFDLDWLYKPILKTPLSSIAISDPVLQRCIANTAKLYAEDIVDLKCINITYLDGIEFLSNLETLTLIGYSKNSLASLAPLLGLKKIKRLTLSDVPVTDEVLFSLKGFEFYKSDDQVDLTIYKSLITSRSLQIIADTFKGNSNVSLELKDNKIESITALVNIDGLSYLDLSNNPLDNAAKELDLLSGLTKLKHLKVANVGLETLDNIRFPRGLEILDLSHNAFSSIAPIALNVNKDTLSELLLNGISANDFHVLGMLDNLVSLSLRNTSVRNIDFVRKLLSLESLTLSGTRVSFIDPVFSLPRFQYLDTSETSLIRCNQYDLIRKSKIYLHAGFSIICRRGDDYIIDILVPDIVRAITIDGIDQKVVDGKIVFSPRKGATSGYIAFTLYGYNERYGEFWFPSPLYYIDIEPVENKRRKLPLWLFLS